MSELRAGTAVALTSATLEGHLTEWLQTVKPQLRVERATWTADELRSFLEHVAGDRLFIAYLLLATTGMRRGGVFGLRWRDVDFTARRVSVTQTITTVNDKLVNGPTKTTRS